MLTHFGCALYIAHGQSVNVYGVLDHPGHTGVLCIEQHGIGFYLGVLGQSFHFSNQGNRNTRRAEIIHF